MDAKLNHSDLSALLAKQAEISGAKAEAFTKAFFDVLLEGLEKDGMVKINGLGTFKVTEVASRSSVDVNTGEKIEIKGHKKLNFLPADALKEKVNQPFAMFGPVEIDDSYVDDNEETDADDTLAQESATALPEDAPQAAPETEDITLAEQQPDVQIERQDAHAEGGAPEEIAEQSQERESPATEELVVPDETAEETTEQPQTTSVTESETSEMSNEEPVAATEEREEQPAAETSAQPEVKNSYPITESASEETPKKERKHTSSYTLYILAAILVAVVVYFYYSHNSSVQTKHPTVAVATPVAQTTYDTAKQQQPDTATTVAEPVPVPEEKPYTFTMLDELAAKSVGSVGRGDTLLYIADGSIATHTVAADETLVRIALKYYGDKRLWPYIVQHNKLHDPNGLNKGMELQIPRLQPAK